MDEEQEGKQNGPTMADKAIDTASDTANAIKDGSNLAKDVATGNVLGGVKHTTNLLRNKTFRRILLVALLIPTTIIVALLFPVFTIFDGVGNKLREIGESAVDFFTVDNEGVIEITETEEMDIVNDTIKAIEDLGITLDDLHLMGDVDYSDPEIEAKAKEALKKYIKKFYEAQAVTQTLYTNPGWFTEAILNNGKTYGKVFVYRSKGEDTVDETNSEPLRYRPYEEMQALQQSGNLFEIKNYYSVNNQKLVVPEWTTTTVNGASWTEISLREVDYKNVVSQYTVPAQFFVYLTITTKNPEFVAAFSDLVKDSEIRLTILDTNTVTTETETYTYTEHEKETIVSEVLDQGQIIEVVDDVNREENKKKVTTIKVDTTVSTLKVTYVKTWATEQSITYKKKNIGPIEDEPDIRDSSNDQNLKDEPEPSEPPKGTTVTWKTNQKKVVERTTSGYTYEEDNRGEVIDKTGEKGSQGLNANGKVDKNTTFLGLLDDKFKIPNTSDEEAAGHNSFVQNADWFFYLLEKEDSLQTLEQLMKYIYYKYTEDDRYGVTDFNFSIFEIHEFQNILSGGVLSNYIKAWENLVLWKYETGETAIPPTQYITTKDGQQYYIVYEDGSAGHNNVAYGLATYISNKDNVKENHPKYGVGYYNWESEFSAYGVNVRTLNTGDLVNKENAMAAFAQILQKFENIVDNHLSNNGITLEQSQRDALVAVCYQYGNIGNFAEAYRQCGNTDVLKTAFKTANGVQPFNGSTDRKNANWQLFHIGKYMTKEGKEIASGIIGIADQIHKYMEQNSYSYCVRGSNSYEECNKLGKSHGLSTTFEESKTNKNTCCATYISWVLQEAGYFTSADHTNGAHSMSNKLKEKGWKVITNALELQPGDIVYFSYGHVEIYAGDGKVYNAGSGKAIRGTSPVEDSKIYSSEFTCGYRPQN